MDEKTKTTYMRQALGMAGIASNEATCEMIWRLWEGVTEKGGDFSLRDATTIETLVVQKYDKEPERLKEKKAIASKRKTK